MEFFGECPYFKEDPRPERPAGERHGEGDAGIPLELYAKSHRDECYLAGGGHVGLFTLFGIGECRFLKALPVQNQ